MANLVWNSNGVMISDIVSAKYRDQSLIIYGSGMLGSRWFTYEAMVTAKGWAVTIHTTTGRMGEYIGATFNLPLEVATAAGRLM